MAFRHEEILEAAEGCLNRWKRASKNPRLLFIGVGGGSGSGKTTLAQQMRGLLEPLRVTVINQDRFFKPNDEKPRYFSKIYQTDRPDYNRPDSFRTEEMVGFCRNVADMDVAILEGILTLHFSELRELMDMKIFVHVDADERITRRIRRNLAHYPFDEIANYYLESVRYRHLEFCEPTRHHADMIIEGGMAFDEARNQTMRVICDRIALAFEEP